MGDEMKNRKLVCIIAILAILVAVLAYLNYRGMNIGAADAEEGIIFVKLGDTEEMVSPEIISSLPSVEFDAIQDTSDSGPEKHHFKGILFKDLLLKVNPGFEDLGLKKVVVKGLDGYSVAFGMDEVIESSSIYLAYEKDGKPLGTKRTGGSGPYQLIAKKDAFSMRWCKFVSEVTAE
jgi:hypothetical protein